MSNNIDPSKRNIAGQDARKIASSKPTDEAQEIIDPNLLGNPVEDDTLIKISSSLTSLIKNFLASLKYVVFRPYQEQALNNIRKAKKGLVLGHENVKSTLLVSPTGSGKTTIFSADILMRALQEGKKVLVIGHRDFLKKQIEERLKQICPNRYQESLENKILQANSVEDLMNVDDNKSIVIASPNLLREIRDNLPDYYRNLDEIVIDEAHHYTSRDYFQTISDIVASQDDQSKLLYILGATATPLRHTPGVVPMSDLFPLDNLVRTTSFLQLVREQVLKRPNGIRIQTNLGSDLSIDEETGNINSADLKELSEQGEFNNLLFDSYEKYNKGNNAIFFAHDLDHCEALLNMANERGYNAAIVDGSRVLRCEDGVIQSDETDSKARERLFRDYGSKVNIIINCNVLQEAADLPETQCVVYGSATRSVPELAQLLGRGARMNPERPDEKEFNFIFLDPQTKQKINFANFADLGLEQFERTIPGDIGLGLVERAEPEPLQELIAVDSLDEGYLVDKPDAIWNKLLLNYLKLSYPHKHPKESLNELVEKIAYSRNTELNVRDIVLGNDILFGYHQSSKIKKCQEIFRSMLEEIKIPVNEIRDISPQLTGFSNFDELSDFLKDLTLYSPVNSIDFDNLFSKQYGINTKLVQELYEAKYRESAPMSFIMTNEIWTKTWDEQFSEVEIALRQYKKDYGRNSLSLNTVRNDLRKLLKSVLPDEKITIPQLSSKKEVHKFLLAILFSYKLHNAQSETLIKGFEVAAKYVNYAAWIDKMGQEVQNRNLPESQVNKLATIGVRHQEKVPAWSVGSKNYDIASDFVEFGDIGEYGSLERNLELKVQDELGINLSQIKDIVADKTEGKGIATKNSLSNVLQALKKEAGRIPGIDAKIRRIVENLSIHFKVITAIKKLKEHYRLHAATRMTMSEKTNVENVLDGLEVDYEKVRKRPSS